MIENAIIEAIACPLFRDQIDTDALIPVSENTRLSSQGFGDALFAAWRYTNIAARTPDPEFILNRAPFSAAQILIAGRNMGSGSSRESAVWALRDYGFKAVIAISFNETFLQNCVANGIWPLIVNAEDVAALCAAVEANPYSQVKIDLDARCITANKGYPFQMDLYFSRLLGEGLTEDLLLESRRPAILAKLAERHDR